MAILGRGYPVRPKYIEPAVAPVGPVTVTGAATLGATSNLTVGALVTEVAAGTMASTSNLTVSGVVTKLAAATLAATSSLTMRVGYSGTVLTLSPDGYWRLGETAGTTAVDLSG